MVLAVDPWGTTSFATDPQAFASFATDPQAVASFATDPQAVASFGAASFAAFDVASFPGIRATDIESSHTTRVAFGSIIADDSDRS